MRCFTVLTPVRHTVARAVRRHVTRHLAAHASAITMVVCLSAGALPFAVLLHKPVEPLQVVIPTHHETPLRRLPAVPVGGLGGLGDGAWAPGRGLGMLPTTSVTSASATLASVAIPEPGNVLLFLAAVLGVVLFKVTSR